MNQPISITVRLFAAARRAAGTDRLNITLGPDGSLFDALKDSSADLARVAGICTLLVEGRRVNLNDITFSELYDGAVVDLLPPFSGG